RAPPGAPMDRRRARLAGRSGDDPRAGGLGEPRCARGLTASRHRLADGGALCFWTSRVAAQMNASSYVEKHSVGNRGGLSQNTAVTSPRTSAFGTMSAEPWL